VGTSQDFGWTHTTNYDDYCDMYRLVVRKHKGLEYRMDGVWKPLVEKKVKLKVTVGGIIEPVTKTFYQCEYGPVLKNKNGYFALRFPALFRVGAAEQWYTLNKAKDYDSFMQGVKRMQTPNQNIVYADKQGTIFFMGYALFPERDPNFYWRGILPGDTSATLWKDTFKPLDSLVWVQNPKCGWVFNNNNSSLHCTSPEENPDPRKFGPTMGLQQKHTARSIRVEELMAGRKRMTYEDLKVLKYDSKLPMPLYTRTIENLDLIRQLDAAKYPDIADVIAAMHDWDGSVTADNKGAAIFAVALHHMIPYLRDNAIPDLNNTFPEEQFVEALRFSRKHLLRHFGRIDVPLGEVQRHVRGDVSLPLWGVPEAITQMYTEPWEKGRFRGSSGESFILFATYGDNGLEKLETINCYGASSHPDSPHYTDQMELFVNKKLKPMTLDKDEILRHAEKVYHPG
jgi:acyl-homoserine-lactone acylase